MRLFVHLTGCSVASGSASAVPVSNASPGLASDPVKSGFEIGGEVWAPRQLCWLPPVWTVLKSVLRTHFHPGFPASEGLGSPAKAQPSAAGPSHPGTEPWWCQASDGSPGRSGWGESPPAVLRACRAWPSASRSRPRVRHQAHTGLKRGTGWVSGAVVQVRVAGALVQGVEADARRREGVSHKGVLSSVSNM